jgi:heme-degrading monooxygenase HmoA
LVLEIVTWDIKPNQEQAFESAFAEAQNILSNAHGYKSHQFQKCIEKPNRYVLLVEWDKLENHTVGFQKSVEYQTYRALIKKYYEPGATLEHYELIHKKVLLHQFSPDANRAGETGVCL